MTSNELRHHAWNYGQLAGAAELHATHATSDDEVDLWNEVLLRLLDCEAALTAAADRADERAGMRLPFGRVG